MDIRDGVLYRINKKDVDKNGVFIIPDEIVALGDRCFSNDQAIKCDFLKKVIFNGKIDKIPERAFYLSNIKEVVFKNKIKVIDKEAFKYCEKLKAIDLEKVVNIKDSAFYSSGIKELKIFYRNILGEKSFYDCKKLKTVYIEDGITKLGQQIFEYCINLEEVRLPSSLIVIPSRLFFDCKKLKEIDIPEGIKEIHSTAFYGCKSLKKLVIPSSVFKIGYNVFDNCDSLEYLEIPLDCKVDITQNFPKKIVEIVGKSYNGNMFRKTEHDLKEFLFILHLKNIDKNSGILDGVFDCYDSGLFSFVTK